MTLTSDNENMLIVDELAIGNKTYDIPKQGRCQGMMKKGNEGALESLVLRGLLMRNSLPIRCHVPLFSLFLRG